ncbi:MAG TPA: hypothetical protein VK858_11135 [Longimicrobiales bacterium]|nr:hypothetical protein [Longimicrobiales bacterium]
MTDREEARWITVATFAARYLAEIPIQTLEGAGIPVLVKGEEPGIWGPGFAGPTSQGVALMVPGGAREEALEILDGLTGDDEEE